MRDWHFELALQQELNRLEEIFTAWILEDFPNLDFETALGDGPEAESVGLTPHQFAQLLQVAQDSESVLVIVNYLRYQIGRSGKDTDWRWQELGEYVVQLLQQDVLDTARQAADRAAERVGTNGQVATSAQRCRAWVLATRLFLAVLRRRFLQRFREFDVQYGA